MYKMSGGNATDNFLFFDKTMKANEDNAHRNKWIEMDKACKQELIACR